MPKIDEFIFSEEKDRVLRKDRGIGFKEIITYIEAKRIIDDKDHHNQTKYSGQRVFMIDIEDYVWWVPYREDKKGIHLITAFPSRKANKAHRKSVKNETD